MVHHQVVQLLILVDLEEEVGKKLHLLQVEVEHLVKEVMVVMVPTMVAVAVAERSLRLK